MAITLLRHGLTLDNEKGRYIGWTNGSLSEDGRTMLYRQRNELSYPHPDVLYSSDLLRCQETANILYPTTEVLLMPEFRELNFGTWEGKTYEELKNDSLYQAWLTSPFHTCPLNGESFKELEQRVLKGIKKILNNTALTGHSEIVIMTHGGVIRLLLEHFAPAPLGFWDWKVGYGSGYRLIGKTRALLGGKRCTLLQEVPITERENGYRRTIN